jgi:hypothetical protein
MRPVSGLSDYERAADVEVMITVGAPKELRRVSSATLATLSLEPPHNWGLQSPPRPTNHSKGPLGVRKTSLGLRVGEIRCTNIYHQTEGTRHEFDITLKRVEPL